MNVQIEVAPPESGASTDPLAAISDESLADYLKRRRATIPPIVYLPTAAGVATAPWGPVVVVAGASALVGWGASAYEDLAPQSTREQIDEGLQDPWNAVGKVFA